MNTAEYMAVWLVGSVIYGAVGLAVARQAYGQARARRIDYREKNSPLSGAADPVTWFNRFDRLPYLATCLLCGAAWPWAVALYVLVKSLIGVTARVVRFLENTPVKSSYEKSQEKRDAA